MTTGEIRDGGDAARVSVADRERLRYIERTARAWMTELGLNEWRYRWDGSPRRFGYTWHTRRIIVVSQPLTLANGYDEPLETVLHEIAHALVGPGFGHGPVWQAKASAIGARPEPCYPPEVIRPAAAKGRSSEGASGGHAADPLA